MTKKISLSVLALTLVACVLCSAILIVGAVLIVRTQRVSAATTVPLKPTATLSVPSVDDANLPANIAKQMDEIQSQVMSYRGLEMNQPLKRALMTPAKLQDQVVNEFFKDYSAEDAKKDVEILSTLGLLAPGFDLHQFYLDLYSEQIAGYYDDKTKDMYVISGETFGGTERMTYAHEFTHALQDQNYDLENGLKMNEEYCKNETEYCAAVTALVEGDATLSEQYWYLKYSSEQDKQQISDFQKTYASPVYDSAPEYMKQDFLFPYQQGYNFVSYLYSRNKWQSIDAAFKNPPVSTEQILHPDKYPTDKPDVVSVPDLLPVLGNGWTEDDRNVMGEWYTYLVLADGRDVKFRLPDTDAKDASAGWGGDTYIYYSNTADKQFAFVWDTQWDSSIDSNQFWQASQNYGNDRWGTPQSTTKDRITWQTTSEGLVTMRQSGKHVLWLMAPSAEIQTALFSALEKKTN